MFSKKAWMILGLALLPLAPSAGWGHDMPDMSGQKVPAAYEKLKGLVGTWTGHQEMMGKMMDFEVTYELTGGGSALVERLFKGTPHEMTSVYFVQGGQVAMTHYCMMGNHPTMALKASDADSLSFELRGKEGLTTAKEPHMHAMKLTWKDADHITSSWTSFKDGKKMDCANIELTRKK